MSPRATRTLDALLLGGASARHPMSHALRPDEDDTAVGPPIEAAGAILESGLTPPADLYARYLGGVEVKPQRGRGHLTLRAQQRSAREGHNGNKSTTVRHLVCSRAKAVDPNL